MSAVQPDLFDQPDLAGAAQADAIITLRFDIGLGGDDVDQNHRIGTLELLRRLEAVAVDIQRREEQFGRKCEAKAQGSPSSAASIAPKLLDLRIESGTSVPAAGTA